PMKSKGLRSMAVALWPFTPTGEGPLGERTLDSRPAQKDAARGEARTEGRQHDAVAVREAPALVPLRERNRNRRGDRIAVAIEIDDDAIETEAQPLAHRLDDAPIGLMRDQPGEIGDRHVVALRSEERRV